ncbi:hypothetical protein ACX801_24965 [Arthrobacter bambusae]
MLQLRVGKVDLFGTEGQKFGYLYDVELHTTLYNTYLPGTVVRWETLKTRGDATCGFRIEVSDEAIAAAAAAGTPSLP